MFLGTIHTDRGDWNKPVSPFFIVDKAMVMKSVEDAGDGQALKISEVPHRILAFARTDEGRDGMYEVLLAIHRLQFPVGVLREHLIVVYNFVWFSRPLNLSIMLFPHRHYIIQYSNYYNCTGSIIPLQASTRPFHG